MQRWRDRSTPTSNVRCQSLRPCRLWGLAWAPATPLPPTPVRSVGFLRLSNVLDDIVNPGLEFGEIELVAVEDRAP
jgi:hypothetical protein